MPVIPSFGTWAPQPNLAESFIGGARIQQAAAQAAQELQVQRERMSMQKQQFEMEQASKQKVFEQEQLRRQSELAVESAYKQAMMGLQERKLEEDAQMDMARIATTAAHYQGLENAANARNFMSAQNLGETTRHHTEMEGLARTRADAAAAAANAPLNYGPPTPVANIPGLYEAQVGPRARQFLRTPAMTPEGALKTYPVLDPNTGQPMPGNYAVPGASGRMTPHTIPRPVESPEVKAARVRIKDLESAYPQLKTGEAVRSPEAKKVFPAKKKEYEELKALVARGAAAASPVIPGPTMLGSTNSFPKILRRFKSGE